MARKIWPVKYGQFNIASLAALLGGKALSGGL